MSHKYRLQIKSHYDFTFPFLALLTAAVATAAAAIFPSVAATDAPPSFEHQHNCCKRYVAPYSTTYPLFTSSPCFSLYLLASTKDAFLLQHNWHKQIRPVTTSHNDTSHTHVGGNIIVRLCHRSK